MTSNSIFTLLICGIFILCLSLFSLLLLLFIHTVVPLFSSCFADGFSLHWCLLQSFQRCLFGFNFRCLCCSKYDIVYEIPCKLCKKTYRRNRKNISNTQDGAWKNSAKKRLRNSTQATKQIADITIKKISYNRSLCKRKSYNGREKTKQQS